MPKHTYLTLLLLVIGCASTEIIESPKTAFVSQQRDKKTPAVIWTSRTFPQKFDYLGLVKVRSWTYQGGLDQLVETGTEMGADAMIDVHYQQVGFFSTFEAFAIKYQ